jgi:hypothetical protein
MFNLTPLDISIKIHIQNALLVRLGGPAKQNKHESDIKVFWHKFIPTNPLLSINCWQSCGTIRGFRFLVRLLTSYGSDSGSVSRPNKQCLCLWELLWFHCITVPVPLRKKVTVPLIPVTQHCLLSTVPRYLSVQYLWLRVNLRHCYSIPEKDYGINR